MVRNEGFLMPPVAAIAGAAVVGAGASIIGGNKAANAQKDAANTAAAASERATQAQIEEQRRQYDQTRADYAPYRETGYKALDTLAGLYGVGGTKIDPTAALEATPGYQFQRDQGLQAIDRANAARGILNSGGADKARMRYASGLAASNYESFTNRLAAMAGVGQSATGSTAAAGQGAANAITGAIGTNAANVGNAAIQGGNARASSYANTANAINGTASNLASLYLYNQNGGFSSPYGGSLGSIY
jgi:hypothetical protein